MSLAGTIAMQYMKLLPPIITERDKITRVYRLAVYSYATPFLFLGLHLLESATFGLTQMFFFALFLGSMLPLGTIGLVCTGLGLRLAFQSSDYQKKDIGYANLLMGLVLVTAGLLAMGLIFYRPSQYPS